MESIQLPQSSPYLVHSHSDLISTRALSECRNKLAKDDTYGVLIEFSRSVRSIAADI
jgi:hypothetical protein